MAHCIGRVDKGGIQDKNANAKVVTINGELETRGRETLAAKNQQRWTKMGQQQGKGVRLNNLEADTNTHQQQDSEPVPISNVFTALLTQNGEGESDEVVLKTHFSGYDQENNGT